MHYKKNLCENVIKTIFDAKDIITIREIWNNVEFGHKLMGLGSLNL
jgi:hypothetical protein